jgi:ribosomal RNA methyltransferase Nop2
MSSSEYSEEEDDELGFEQQAARLEREDDEEEEEAAAELRHTIKTQSDVVRLPERKGSDSESDDNEEEGITGEDPAEIHARIKDLVQVLAHFKDRRQPGKSRSDYIDQLSRDFADYYG